MAQIFTRVYRILLCVRVPYSCGVVNAVCCGLGFTASEHFSLIQLIFFAKDESSSQCLVLSLGVWIMQLGLISWFTMQKIHSGHDFAAFRVVQQKRLFPSIIVAE